MAFYHYTQIDSFTTQNLRLPPRQTTHTNTYTFSPSSPLLHRHLPAAVASAENKESSCLPRAHFSSACFLFLSASLPILETLITPTCCCKFHTNDKAFFPPCLVKSDVFSLWKNAVLQKKKVKVNLLVKLLNARLCLHSWGLTRRSMLIWHSTWTPKENELIQQDVL